MDPPYQPPANTHRNPPPPNFFLDSRIPGISFFQFVFANIIDRCLYGNCPVIILFWLFFFSLVVKAPNSWVNNIHLPLVFIRWTSVNVFRSEVWLGVYDHRRLRTGLRTLPVFHLKIRYISYNAWIFLWAKMKYLEIYQKDPSLFRHNRDDL